MGLESHGYGYCGAGRREDRHDYRHGERLGLYKLSAAVCRAFSENPLLQTLLMWDGWQTDTEAYGPAVVREHEWSFGGMGMSALLRHLRANGCHVSETLDKQCDPVAYTATRDMPASFVALV